MQKILVATDGSRGGNRAVIAAAQLVKATGAALSVVTVSGNLHHCLRCMIGSRCSLTSAESVPVSTRTRFW
jgi:nucleotide-binding universal stress UspA family protein